MPPVRLEPATPRSRVKHSSTQPPLSVAATRPRGGGTLKFPCIRRLGPFFLGSKFRISIFFGVFRKMNIFLGYEDFVDIFLGSSKNWASLRVISMQFRVFF